MIVPKTIEKPIRERIAQESQKSKVQSPKFTEIDLEALTPGEAKKLIPRLRREMRQAAAALDFERAAQIRDLIQKISS